MGHFVMMEAAQRGLAAFRATRCSKLRVYPSLAALREVSSLVAILRRGFLQKPFFLLLSNVLFLFFDRDSFLGGFTMGRRTQLPSANVCTRKRSSPSCTTAIAVGFFFMRAERIFQSAVPAVDGMQPVIVSVGVGAEGHSAPSCTCGLNAASRGGGTSKNRIRIAPTISKIAKQGAAATDIFDRCICGRFTPASVHFSRSNLLIVASS